MIKSNLNNLFILVLLYFSIIFINDLQMLIYLLSKIDINILYVIIQLLSNSIMIYVCYLLYKKVETKNQQFSVPLLAILFVSYSLFAQKYFLRITMNMDSNFAFELFSSTEYAYSIYVSKILLLLTMISIFIIGSNKLLINK